MSAYTEVINEGYKQLHNFSFFYKILKSKKITTFYLFFIAQSFIP